MDGLCRILRTTRILTEGIAMDMRTMKKLTRMSNDELIDRVSRKLEEIEKIRVSFRNDYAEGQKDTLEWIMDLLTAS